MRLSWIALIAVLTACGGSVSGSANSVTGSGSLPPSTVSGVGILPATIPAAPPAEFESLVTRPLTADGEFAEPIGDQVAGNRLLMIGDSILASTETRYGGEMCAALEPLGWAVEVAAEAGRFVEFGVSVVNQRVPRPSADQTNAADVNALPLPAGATDWDVAAVFLGSNYDGDKENYDTKMREILDRLAPRPTLLFTVTEYRPNYSDVTAVINDLAIAYPNVTLIDWAAAARTPGVLLPDGLHPNDVGESVLTNLTAVALGEAPAGEAECIRSQFRDDSAIDEGNGSPNTGGSTSGTPRPVPTTPNTGSPGTTTVVTPTTVAPTSVMPTSVMPTSVAPTTAAPTSVTPTSVTPTSVTPTTAAPTTASGTP
ncbi:MAG: hypothetical protein P8M10_07635 [Ilumatobacter sp.]|nr:hypothetical protein [Ilumatobacter sp.]